MVKFSKEFSMAGWDLLTYIKDRRKAIIAIVAVGVTYGVSNSELAAIIAGVVFEGLVSVAEFYLKKVKL